MMAVPAAVQTQLDAINTNLNKVINDRERLKAWFDDGLGNSVWNLLSAQNQGTAKTALVTDMQSAIDGLQSAKNALAAM